MKSYTNLEQSKKLTEILPLKSADMCYLKREINDTFIETPIVKPEGEIFKSLSCWSLAALLDVMPSASLDSSDDRHYRLYCMERFTEWYDNPIDACYEMILKLHELKML